MSTGWITICGTTQIIFPPLSTKKQISHKHWLGSWTNFASFRQVFPYINFKNRGGIFCEGLKFALSHCKWKLGQTMLCKTFYIQKGEYSFNSCLSAFKQSIYRLKSARPEKFNCITFVDEITR